MSPARALFHPLWLAGLALYALNDHVLKGSTLLPQAVIGKLSDVGVLLVTPAVLRKYRRLSYVGIAIASAVLTPPDPGSMILMMVPLVVLYEMSIWLSYLVIRRKKKAAAQEEAPAEGPQESKGPKKDYDLDNAKKP